MCSSGSVHLLNDAQQQQQSDVRFDNWEIDPRNVALGVEIGQGAFGRVLTGFYHNQQVAIKVLKGILYSCFSSLFFTSHLWSLPW